MKQIYPNQIEELFILVGLEKTAMNQENVPNQSEKILWKYPFFYKKKSRHFSSYHVKSASTNFGSMLTRQNFSYSQHRSISEVVN